MAEVVLEKISKHFGPTMAVNELSLTIADGEFIVLLGPTGAGKTTTLRLVAGLEKPDNGKLLIDDRDLSDAPIADRDVAFVFQQYSLYPHYTVFDNLAFPLRAPLRKQSVSEVKQRVLAVAELLRIESKLNNKATQLSGGEMQRVAIGRALVREPAVFLMDEPLSSLDAKLREDLRVELKRIQTDLGATILYVTHDQIEAMTLADRIGVLDQGRLAQVGTPREIYAQPTSIYAAQRLGSPPINLLPVGLLEQGAPETATQVGIRPEDLVVGQSGVAAQIIQVEHLGAETVLVLEVADQRVHALAASAARLRPGQQTQLASLPDTALYFDATGQRVES